MKIVEGLHVEEVTHLSGYVLFLTCEKKRSLCWKPKPKNWMAAEIMRVLLTKKESE